MVHRNFTSLQSLKKSRAFTLLEVLIAIGISAFIYMGAYSLLDSVIRTDESVSKKRMELEEIQRAFQLMQQDIEQIVARSSRMSSGEPEPAVVYKSVDKKLEFTRLGWRNPIKRPRSTMQRVAYVVEDKILYREHWLVLDRTSESESRKNQLIEGVDEMSIRFYDTLSKQWVDDWSKELTDKQPLPAAIEITLQTTSFGELVRVFRLVDNMEVEDDGL
jgi:general secretion pathway protein J